MLNFHLEMLVLNRVPNAVGMFLERSEFFVEATANVRFDDC